MVAGLAKQGVLVESETVTAHRHHVALRQTRVAAAPLPARGIKEVHVGLEGISLHKTVAQVYWLLRAAG